MKAIIFDCFGVLTTDGWRAFLDNLPEDADAETARELNHAYDSGVIDREEFLEGVKEATGHKPKEVEDVLWNEVDKNEKLLDYIRNLRKRGYRIGLLSNVATNWIRESFLSEEEQELFDLMILSHEVGMIKPDPRLFMLVCQRLRVGPHEAVFIDDVERYCEAAKVEGLKAIVYKDFKQMKNELELVLKHPGEK